MMCSSRANIKSKSFKGCGHPVSKVSNPDNSKEPVHIIFLSYCYMDMCKSRPFSEKAELEAFDEGNQIRE